MSKHECESCGEEFETLTRLRLHDCETESPEEVPAQDHASDESDGRGSEGDTPWEVEENLEPEYDCPECDYYSTGLSSGPHEFLDHLRDEHGYSGAEAHEVLNG